MPVHKAGPVLGVLLPGPVEPPASAELGVRAADRPAEPLAPVAAEPAAKADVQGLAWLRVVQEPGIGALVPPAEPGPERPVDCSLDYVRSAAWPH